LAHTIAWTFDQENRWSRPLKIAYRFALVVLAAAAIMMLANVGNA
jgi:hypothetical protein